MPFPPESTGRRGRRPPSGPGLPPDLGLPPPPPGIVPPVGPGSLPPPMMGGPGLGPPPLLPPGMAKPGQGMDAMAAMMGGLGLPPASDGAPMGPGGLPFGANPVPKLDEQGNPLPPDTGGSDLLALLTGGATPGDPYTLPPGATNTNLAGIGPQDPQLGMEEMLQLLALVQMGAAGNPQLAGGMPGPMGRGGMPPVPTGGAGLPPGLF